ncbi:MAG: hypothetical protein HQ513_12105, partial [Rhodospirillales bacterium]|nr:hypothetical protein [Rhodospirillales bacterium]
MTMRPEPGDMPLEQPAADEKARPRLCLEQIDAAFDPLRDVPAGPYCFTGVEDIYPDWEKLTFDDPFPDLQGIEAGAENIRRLNAYWVDRLTHELNARHGLSYSRRFWYVVITPWLLELIQFAWQRYLIVERLIARHGDRDITVQIWDGEHAWEFETAADFSARGILQPLFNSWVYSLIIRTLAPSRWHLERTVPSADDLRENQTWSPRPLQRSFRARLAEWVRMRLGFTAIPGARWETFVLAIYANLLPRRQTRAGDPVVTARGNDFAPGDVFPQPFLEILTSLIEQTMPRFFRESFLDFLRTAKRGRYVKGRLRLGVIDFLNEAERLRTALALEAGERLVIPQHGGFYGQLHSTPTPGENEFFGDAFLTWGWTSNRDYPDARFVAVPSPEASACVNKHQFKDASLIFVVAAFWTNCRRVNSGPQPSEMMAWRQEKVSFFDGLDENIQPDAWYRPYLRGLPTGRLDSALYVQKHCPWVKFLEGDLMTRLLSCRLAVMDHPG